MKRVHTDSFEVTRDEALELCLHHLKCAQLFFESGPEALYVWTEETQRILGRGIQGVKSPECIAALTWLETIHAHYESLKKDD